MTGKCILNEPIDRIVLESKDIYALSVCIYACFLGEWNLCTIDVMIYRVPSDATAV